MDECKPLVVGVAVTTTGKKIAFKQYPGNFETKGGNALTALYEVTEAGRCSLTVTYAC